MFTYYDNGSEKNILLIGIEEEIFINIILENSFIKKVNYSIINKSDKDAISKGLKKINSISYDYDRGLGIVSYEIANYLNREDNRELFYEVDILKLFNTLITLRESIRYEAKDKIESLSFFKKRKFKKLYQKYYGE